MEMKHTKGPWQSFGVRGYQIPIGTDKKTVAFTSTSLDGKEKDEALANAKLIAAAPDLLEALILANEMLFSVAINADLANKIELAIKKATV